MRLLRILSQSASPSKSELEAAWLEGFQAGYGKAWELMTPLVVDGMKQARAIIHDAAVEKTLDGLEQVIEARVKERLNGHSIR